MEYVDSDEFRGVRMTGVDLSGARMHDVNLEGARITDAFLLNADISGLLIGTRINGVEIAPLVEAELDRMYPERVRLRPSDVAGLRDGWALVVDIWNGLVERARGLPEPRLHERVDGEWSFLETLRHLVFVSDAWCTRMVQGNPAPYHPWGVVPRFLASAGLPVDPVAAPTFDDVLAVRRQRHATVLATIDGLSDDNLARVATPPDAPGYPNETGRSVLDCLRVVLGEEWEHSRYAARDLDVLERG
jgi:uncharacterized protein YjbI with pentapeptide repeats